MYTRDYQLRKVRELAKLENSRVEDRVIMEILDADTDEAVGLIREVRGGYKNTQRLPDWLRQTIFFVIYGELQKESPSYLQGELLEKMDLSVDCFTKHWHMLPPAQAVKRNKFYSFNMGFHDSEVESNPVYLAMIHYLLCFTSVYTESFVDVIGHMGVVECQCATGYKYKALNKYHSFYASKFLEFKDAMKHPDKVYNEFSMIRNEIGKYEQRNKQAEEISKRVQQYWIELMGMTKNEMTSYKKAAQYIFIHMFSPIYYQRKYLVQYNRKSTKTDYDMMELEAGDIKYQDIENFLERDCKKDFKLYGGMLQKNIEVFEVPVLNMIPGLVKANKNFLLYLDMPKAIPEYQRFSMNAEEYMEIIRYLLSYKGEWILVWKKYIDISENEFAREDFKQDALLHLLKTESVEDVSVFKHTCSQGNESRSIVFITNIDFEAIDYGSFAKLYQGDHSGDEWCKPIYDPELKKLSIDKL